MQSMRRILCYLCFTLIWASALLSATSARAGLPEGFVPAYANETEGVKIVQYIPEGETDEAWSEMYTFLVFKKAQASQYLSVARHFGEELQTSCEGAKLRGQHVDAEKMYLLAFECPAVSASAEQSESMVGLLRPYKENVLFVQYVRRGPKGSPPDSTEMINKLYEAAH
ncbi:hypothetical protein N1030_10085 [Desulfovibrio mangrovi]|uniref:hypothetical protein n=1 Tax=Desulfovibrio mangrovi TaxID=2976983 RepID=UPI0022455FC0|nr:hypothetical protein [Desulfovibrio mangrovi]UZP65973.1 hypothetical protein N1030_10085 [Desulfovibrio mangrovi]